MKAKRFVGANSRAVLQLVRSELGADAVILANRSVPDGVEILAIAADAIGEMVADEGMTAPQAADPVRAAAPARTPAPARAAAPVAAPAPAAHVVPSSSRAKSNPLAGLGEEDMTSLMNYVGRERANLNSIEKAPARVAAPVVASTAAKAPAKSAPAATVSAPAVAREDAALMAEIKAMKGMLQEQLAGLAWDQTVRTRPLRAYMLRSMLASGFGPLLSRTLVDRLPDDFSEEAATNWLTSVLAKNINCATLPVANARDIVDEGGVVALVGPTGVGKTTTAAKLAARCVMKYGAGKLGLVTTDGYRIGAQDQLRIYGRILGVPVMVAQDATELEQVLSALSGKHLVLIDTTGMSQRDHRVLEQHRMLDVPGVKRLLLLNAAAQAETLEEVAAAYQPPGSTPLAGAILSKVDEAARLGGALDVVVRHKLKLHYITSGQRVPEDIHPANAQVLAHRALKAGAEGQRKAFSMNDEEAGLVLAGLGAGHTHAPAAVPSMAAA